VSISPGDASNCRCQACGVAGPLLPLLWRLENSGRDVTDLVPFLLAHNQLDLSRIDEPVSEGALAARLERAASSWSNGNGKVMEPLQKPQAEVPESVLARMREWLTDDVRRYFRDVRQLKPLTVEEWELGWHPKEERVCIPIRDEGGKLVSVSGRALVRNADGWTDELPEDFAFPKYLHSPFSRNAILFGMHKLVPQKRVGYLFEGFFQTIFAWQCGYDNVLGRMGTHLAGAQRSLLRKWFDKLILVPDGDPAGFESVEKIAVELEQETDRIPEIIIAKMAEGCDADKISESQLKEFLGHP
jgi:hypothetical protein